MNKKLLRYLDEADKAESRIAEMQEHLKTVREAQQREEDAEILKTVRGMKLSGRDLLAMLSGIQDGSVTLQQLEGAGLEEAPDAGKNHQKQVPEDAPESEVPNEENFEEMG